MKALAALPSTISGTRSLGLRSPIITSPLARPALPVRFSTTPAPSGSFAARISQLRDQLRPRPEPERIARASLSTESPVSSRSTVSPMEVLVKAAFGLPDTLGDCPFSQRVLLTLEEKKVEYNAKFVDMSNKPDWFLEANPEGKVPVIKHEGKWIADSDVITALLEDLYPEPSLKSPEESKSVGSKIFGTFIAFLTSKDPNDGKEQALVAELTALDEHLKKSGKYINGDKVTSVDLALGPKLLHLKVALGHYKNWSFPDELEHLKQYVEDVFSLESFQKTRPKDVYIVKGWESKVLGA